MADIPERLSVDKLSEFYKPSVASKVEVYFNGVRQVNCITEYCISEGWVLRQRRTALGKLMADAKGNVIVDRLEGEVKVEWRNG